MNKKRLVSLILVIALLATTGSALAGSMKNFRAHLSGAGAGTDSQGQGQAIFKLNNDGSEMQYKLIVANIEDVTMAHIHIAPAPGANGPPGVWLYPDAPPAQLIPGRFDGILAQGTFSPDQFVGPLTGMSMDALLTAIAEGRAYVNVHTEAHPGGEIRGDIR